MARPKLHVDKRLFMYNRYSQYIALIELEIKAVDEHSVLTAKDISKHLSISLAQVTSVLRVALPTFGQRHEHHSFF